MLTILTIIFFIFGLIIGSFLNVVILRLHTEKSFGGRSACMSCRSTLSWYELIPVFSYIGLGGKCKSCKTRISIQYPLVEIITGIIFAALFLKFSASFFFDTINFSLTYGYYTVMFCLLLIISVYDIRHKIIPDNLALIFGVLAFLGIFFFDKGFAFVLPSLHDLLAGVVVSVPFALVWFISRGKWMGLGDGKLLVGLGFFLGFWEVITATMISFWIGAVVGVLLLMILRHYGRRSEIPFAPFLAFSAFLVFVFDIYFPIL